MCSTITDITYLFHPRVESMEGQLLSVMDTAILQRNTPADVPYLQNRQGQIQPCNLESVHAAQ